MRKKSWFQFGAGAGVVALAAIAALLAVASGGRAASGGICVTPSTPTSNASCVAQTVTPHVITANGDAISITTFTNESAASTASNVVVGVTFPSPVTVKNLALFVNGAKVFSNPPPTPGPNPCTPSALPASLGAAQTVSCSAGDIAGGGTVRLVVQFSTNTGMVLAGAASYGNDTQTSRDELRIAGASPGIVAQGGCFTTSQATFSAATATQGTGLTVGRVDPSFGLPCSPASAGVDTNPNHHPPGFQDVSFAEFKPPAQGVFGIVIVRFLTSQPASFVLKELIGSDPTLPSSWTPVPNCISGLPPSGIDSCIFRKSTSVNGGLEFNLHVLGSQTDPKYSG